MIAPAPARPYVDEVGADPGRLRIGLLDSYPRRAAGPPRLRRGGRGPRRRCSSRSATTSSPGFPPVMANPEFARKFAALWSTNMGTSFARVAATGRSRAGAGRRRARQLGAGRVRPPVQRRRLRARARRQRRVPARGAGLVDRGMGPAAHARRSPSRRRASASSRTIPTRRWRRWSGPASTCAFTPAFNTSGQPAINVPLHWNARRPPGRHPARRRLRPRGRPDPRRIAARSRHPLGPPHARHAACGERRLRAQGARAAVTSMTSVGDERSRGSWGGSAHVGEGEADAAVVAALVLDLGDDDRPRLAGVA